MVRGVAFAEVRLPLAVLEEEVFPDLEVVLCVDEDLLVVLLLFVVDDLLLEDDF